MTAISKYLYPPIEVEMCGKNRKIRDIKLHSEQDFIAHYRNHRISIFEQEDGGWEFSIIELGTNKLLEDNYFSPFDYENQLSVIEKCIEIILTGKEVINA